MPVAKMRWSDARFAHWRVDPKLLRPKVPGQLELDLADGSAWISAVALRMHRVRVAGMPAPEARIVNLRTYVVRDGEAGIWLLEGGCSDGAVARAGRRFGLPYRSEDAGFQAQWGEPGTEALDDLDRFLTDRSVLFARRGNRWRRLVATHPPWPLWRTTCGVQAWGRLPSAIAGRPPDLAHVSPGVAVVARVTGEPASTHTSDMS